MTPLIKDIMLKNMEEYSIRTADTEINQTTINKEFENYLAMDKIINITFDWRWF